MGEKEVLILSVIFLIVSIVVLVTVSILIKRNKNYRNHIISELEKNSYLYYQELKLLDNEYFPFFAEHASGIISSYKSKGEIDCLSNVSLKKHYKFVKDKIIYIVNNNLHYPLEIVIINERKYIKLSRDIKTIELLVSFEKPSHFLAKYAVKYVNNSFKLELIEEGDNNA